MRTGRKYQGFSSGRAKGIRFLLYFFEVGDKGKKVRVLIQERSTVENSPMQCTSGASSKHLTELNIQVPKHSWLHTRIPQEMVAPQLLVRAAPCPKMYRESLLTN